MADWNGLHVGQPCGLPYEVILDSIMGNVIDGCLIGHHIKSYKMYDHDRFKGDKAILSAVAADGYRLNGLSHSSCIFWRQ